MKRFLFISVFIALVGNIFVQAQSSAIDNFHFKNPSFETWESDGLNGGTGGGGSQPEFWRASNVNQTVIGVNKKQVLVFQDGDKRTGNSSARMENIYVGALGIGSNAPGYITLGTVWVYAETNINNCDGGTVGGISYTHRPDSLVFYMKRNVSGGAEDGRVLVYSWKGSSSTKHDKSDRTLTNQERVILGKYYDGLINTSQDKNITYSSNFELVSAVNHVITDGNVSEWKRVSIPFNYLTDSNPEMLNIVISGCNYFSRSGVKEGNKMWVDDISLIYTPYLKGIDVNGAPLSGFSQQQYEYNVELPLGTQSRPEIVCKRTGQLVSFDWDEVAINTSAGVSGALKINVSSEDGASSSVYKLNISTRLYTDATLSSLSYNLNGEDINIPLFNGVYDYPIELPEGTVEMPYVSAVKNNAFASVSIDQATTLPGSATIRVTAQDGTIQHYTVNFSVEKSSDVSLKSLQVKNGNVSKIDDANYQVMLPQGTVSVPAEDDYIIETTSNKAAYIINHASDLTGKTQIVVTAENGVTSKPYYVGFEVLTSDNNNLSAILVNGVAIENFAAATASYEVSMDYKVSPENIEITAVPADEHALVEVAEITANDQKNIRITVTSESGKVRYYYVSFLSNNAYLNTIKVGGVEPEDFESEKLEYDYELPFGTTAGNIPEVTYEQAHNRARVRPRKASTLPGTTQLSVTADDGTVVDYLINFSVKKNPDVSIATIIVKENEVEIGRLNNPSAGLNTVELGYKATSITSIEVVTTNANIPSEHIDIQFSGALNEGAAIQVLAEDEETIGNYELSFVLGKSNNTNLSSLKINGDDIVGFSRDRNEYTVVYQDLENLPVISVVPEEEVAEVIALIQAATLPGTASFTIKAEDESTKEYQIHFTIERDNANLSKILINEIAVNDFDFEAAINETQYVTLPYGTESVTVRVETEVFGVSVSSKETLSGNVIEGAAFTALVEKTYEIIVLAEDGVTEKVYKLGFLVKKNTNANLAALEVTGYSLAPLFNANELNYTVVRPYGVTDIPDIIYSVEDTENATVEESEPVVKDTGVEVLITVTAHDTSIQKVYSVLFTNALNTDATLAELYVNGQEVALEEGKYDYSYELPYGTTDIPEVIAIPADDRQDEGASLEYEPITLNRAVIYVTASDGETVNEYTITFTIAKNDNANLVSISLNGEAISEFEPDRQVYYKEFPYWTTELPVVSCVLEDENATYNIVPASGLRGGKTIIVVTAENGEVTKSYEINYSLEKNIVATLDVLKVGGQTINGFTPGTARTNYSYTLPKGTTELPTVEFKATDREYALAIVTKQPEEGVSGTFEIVVSAENRTVVKTYIINFLIEKSNDASLDGIYVDGLLVPDFSKEKYSYSVVVPHSTNLPVLSAVATDKDAAVSIEPYSNLSNPIDIVVVSEDNSDTKRYTMNLSMQKSDIATLNEIRIEGVPIAGFDSETYTYQAHILHGSTSAVVGYTTKDPEATVKILSNSLEEGLVLEVTSPDNSTKKEYTVTLIERKNPNANIAQLFIDGVLQGVFNESRTYHEYYVPYGKTSIVLTYELENPNARAVYTPAPSVNGAATITVYPEDELKAPVVYTIQLYPKTLSDIAKLENVRINDMDFIDFNPDIQNYVVDYNASNGLPVVTFDLEDENASVQIKQASAVPGVAEIIVTAPDGTEVIYRLRFRLSTAIGEEQEISNSIVLYPMPVVIDLNIGNMSLENLTFSISDMNGKILLTEIIMQESEKVLTLHSLISGSYIYQFSKENKVVKSGVLLKK